MSSRKGGGRPHNSGANSSNKGKMISEVSPPAVDQVTDGVGDMSLDAAQNEWVVFAKKTKNKAGSSAGKSAVHQNPGSNSGGYPDYQKAGFRNVGSGQGQVVAGVTQAGVSKGTAGRGNTSNQHMNNYNVLSAPIPPPLQRGWNLNRPAASTLFTDHASGTMSNVSSPNPLDVEETEPAFEDEEEENEFDEVDDSDDELLLSDEYDSDESQKSHETRKQKKWFEPFFKRLDTLTVEQINEPTLRQHCPACRNGRGAIKWYNGLQPLITHAKTQGSKWVKLHRELAELLEEELRRRGASAVPAGEAFHKWKGLFQEAKDKDILWPPMIVIMNTQLEKDDNEKWIGMGNQELLDYFSSYAAVKARHSYGPQGHRGMSVLIFEGSARGYLEAERLSKDLEDQGLHRDAWNRRPVLFHPGGNRQLYGFMAQTGDLDLFNRHSPGKSKLKYEIQSYREMVVKQINQMSEDNQRLIWYQDQAVKHKKLAKVLEESNVVLSDKLRTEREVTRIVIRKAMLKDQEHKEERESQDQFYNDLIQVMLKDRDAKDDDFEKIQQEEREKMKQYYANPVLADDPRQRGNTFEEFVKYQDKKIEEYMQKREKLRKLHEEDMLELERKYLSGKVELEKTFDAELNQLREEYAPRREGKLTEQAGSKRI